MVFRGHPAAGQHENEAASHGFVSSGSSLCRSPPGTVIENIANIYFDFNDPVITEPSVLVAEFSTGVEERIEWTDYACIRIRHEMS